MTMLPDRRRQQAFQAKQQVAHSEDALASHSCRGPKVPQGTLCSPGGQRKPAQRILPVSHWYGGMRNTWSEPLHYCGGCDFESHERYKVDQHVEATAEQQAQEDAEEVLAKAIERQKEPIEESYLEMRADLHRGED